MAKLIEKNGFKKDGSKTLNGYGLALSKSGVQKSGFTKEEELSIEYEDGKITITKS